MTSYCGQRYVECLVTTFFVPTEQCTSTPRSARATVELLRQETPNVLEPNLWPPNSPDLSSVDYKIWVVHSVDKLKRRLIDVWNSRFLTRLVTSGEEDIERVSMLKEDISSTACELTMLILFNVTCLTVTSLITKPCQQRWPIHSCSFYKVVH